MNFFDYLKSINETKDDIMITPEDEKAYVPFMVNRGLSYFQDTILLANEMNQHSHLPARMQFDFLRNMVRKRKRFSKWLKAEEITDLEVVKEYYGYSNDKAMQALKLLTSDHITVLKEQLYKGGKKKSK
jgi:hypothetical protein